MELILVVLALGVVSAYFTINWQSPGALTVANQAERLVSHLRYAQSLAIAWEQPLRVALAASDYSVTCVNGIGSAPCVNAGDVVVDPASGESFTFNYEYGVTSSVGNVDFDAQGRPLNGGALAAANQTITLNGDGQAATITVSPLTGFATVTTP